MQNELKLCKKETAFINSIAKTSIIWKKIIEIRQKSAHLKTKLGDVLSI